MGKSIAKEPTNTEWGKESFWERATLRIPLVSGEDEVNLNGSYRGHVGGTENQKHSWSVCIETPGDDEVETWNYQLGGGEVGPMTETDIQRHVEQEMANVADALARRLNVVRDALRVGRSTE